MRSAGADLSDPRADPLTDMNSPLACGSARGKPAVESTLKRPPAKFISLFHVRQVGDDTIADFLTRGWSLAIFCKDCPRTAEWTPPDLVRRFGDRPGLRIADLVPRLSCAGPDGCGSHNIAVGPHAYDGPWSWAPL